MREGERGEREGRREGVGGGEEGEGEKVVQLHSQPLTLSLRFVGPYITLCPDLSFVLEDSKGVCGYVLAALDSQSFYKSFIRDWLPQLAGKYPTLPPPTGDQQFSPEEVREHVHVQNVAGLSPA